MSTFTPPLDPNQSPQLKMARKGTHRRRRGSSTVYDKLRSALTSLQSSTSASLTTLTSRLTSPSSGRSSQRTNPVFTPRNDVLEPHPGRRVEEYDCPPVHGESAWFDDSSTPDAPVSESNGVDSADHDWPSQSSDQHSPPSASIESLNATDCIIKASRTNSAADRASLLSTALTKHNELPGYHAGRLGQTVRCYSFGEMLDCVNTTRPLSESSQSGLPGCLPGLAGVREHAKRAKYRVLGAAAESLKKSLGSHDLQQWRQERFCFGRSG